MESHLDLVQTHSKELVCIARALRQNNQQLRAQLQQSQAKCAELFLENRQLIDRIATLTQRDCPSPDMYREPTPQPEESENSVIGRTNSIYNPEHHRLFEDTTSEMAHQDTRKEDKGTVIQDTTEEPWEEDTGVDTGSEFGQQDEEDFGNGADEEARNLRILSKDEEEYKSLQSFSTAKLTHATPSGVQKGQMQSADHETSIDTTLSWTEQETISLAKDNGLKRRLDTEEQLKPVFQNEFKGQSGRVHIFCKIRDLPGGYSSMPAHQICVRKQGPQTLRLSKPRRSITMLSDEPVPLEHIDYHFDRVFDASASNQMLFNELEPLIASALSGHSICIFCYGATASGKTHTMISSRNSLARMILEGILRELGRDEELSQSFEVAANMFEVYNESVNDLLSAGYEPCELDIRQDSNGEVDISGAQTLRIRTKQGLDRLLRISKENRQTKPTEKNAESSRSHWVLRLVLPRKTSSETAPSIFLVDLAGSEGAPSQERRVISAEEKKWQKQGRVGKLKELHEQKTFRNQEMAKINQSLIAFKAVMRSLHRSERLRCRDSKLTRLLQNPLNGGCEKSKILLIINVNPLQEHVRATSDTLSFVKDVCSLQK